MTRNSIKLMLMASTILGAANAAHAEDVKLTIESWRNDDLSIWQEKIIPAFKAENPGIKVKFTPSAPAEYNAVLNSKLEAGSAGDLITCRPFDTSLALYDKGHLASLADLSGMNNFSDVAKSAWITDGGKNPFCVPMASVIHGFIYNAEALEDAGVAVPTTEAEFFAALDAIKAKGNYIPMAMGTADQWEASTMGYNNIGPNYWKGEEGRNALIAGTQKLTDEAWVAPYRQLAKWKDYLGDGFEAQSYPDSQNVFTLGRAAIYPAGSWEITGFNANADFKMGAFIPPVQNTGDECHISDHTDIAIGMNANTKNADAAKTFLNWVATAEFAKIYANALPGSFPLSSAPVELEDPLAQEFISWRSRCKSTIRSTYQILSRGTPNLENDTWNASANLIKGTEAPEAAGKRLQDGLASWYAPQK